MESDADSEEAGAAKGIAAGLVGAIPIWGLIFLLVGNPWIQKAFLYLLCLSIAALAIWLAKIISPHRDFSTAVGVQAASARSD